MCWWHCKKGFSFLIPCPQSPIQLLLALWVSCKLLLWGCTFIFDVCVVLNWPSLPTFTMPSLFMIPYLALAYQSNVGHTCRFLKIFWTRGSGISYNSSWVYLECWGHGWYFWGCFLVLVINSVCTVFSTWGLRYPVKYGAQSFVVFWWASHIILFCNNQINVIYTLHTILFFLWNISFGDSPAQNTLGPNNQLMFPCFLNNFVATRNASGSWWFG